jgi:hypothetical protein
MTSSRARQAVVIAYVLMTLWLAATALLVRPVMPSPGFPAQLRAAAAKGQAEDITFYDEGDSTGRLTWIESGVTRQATISVSELPQIQSDLRTFGATVSTKSDSVDLARRVMLAVSVLCVLLVLLVVPLALVIDDLGTKMALGEKVGWVAAVIWLPVIGPLAHIVLWPKYRPGTTFVRVGASLAAVALVGAVALAVLYPHGPVMFGVGAPAK